MAEMDTQTRENDFIENIKLAHKILNTIISNPHLAHVHNPLLLSLGDSRWNEHFVMDNYQEIIKHYNVDCYNGLIANENVAKDIKNFFQDTFNYKFRGQK